MPETDILNFTSIQYIFDDGKFYVAPMHGQNTTNTCISCGHPLKLPVYLLSWGAYCVLEKGGSYVTGPLIARDPVETGRVNQLVRVTMGERHDKLSGKELTAIESDGRIYIPVERVVVIHEDCMWNIERSLLKRHSIRLAFDKQEKALGRARRGTMRVVHSIGSLRRDMPDHRRHKGFDRFHWYYGGEHVVISLDNVKGSRLRDLLREITHNQGRGFDMEKLLADQAEV